MPEDDAAFEIPNILVSTDTPDIIIKDDQTYVEVKTVDPKRPYRNDLNEFITNSIVDPSLGEDGSLVYENQNKSRVIVPNKDLQALSFVEKVIEREKRDNILSITEIEAKNKAIQLEDASKSVKDWSNNKFKNIKWERNRLIINDGHINLNGLTIKDALNKVQIVGEKVRIPYKSSKGEESIFYLSLNQAKKIIELSNDLNLKKSLDKINILSKKDIRIMVFDKPIIKGVFIQSEDYEAPKVFLEEQVQIHKSITKKDGSYLVSIYINGSGKPYKLVFNLEDYNNLLQETA